MNPPDNALRTIINTQPDRLYRKGSCLYGADEPFRGLFVIMAGAVKHYRLTEAGDEVVTGFCLPGEWCGLADFSSGRYAGYAQALDTCMVRRFPVPLLADVLKEQPGRQDLYTLMSDVIRKNKARYYQISKVHADVRLAMFIQDLSRRFSRLGYSAHEFRLPMSRSDMANYLGVTPETLSRQITRMIQLGIIELRSRFITIHDLCVLDSFIESKKAL
ncbi:helix-turn-helix domain-containing protein [Klebsiella michiganensis]|uniref:helix-turn-helix domain-containing protein n=1 Tax=Klebsiella michiganensis TaxID=1134687 RepID=UPI003F4F72D4